MVGTDLLVRNESKLKKPKWYAVRLLNDNKTTFQFVEDLCRIIFGKTTEEAKVISRTVNDSGYADVTGPDGPFTFEIAEDKSFICMDRANRVGYPFVADPVEV